ncbi:hypothetical protein [Actinomadura rugatobispora]|uniref:Sensor domain-containing protein n=1 Tax=Actinomadura rugatobispora TaxID=1994 RepID=A0ABW1A7W3_9ACTN|nr:hypothetical protein GCM10010200_088740 [Actinomadura rugatobispora]
MASPRFPQQPPEDDVPGGPLFGAGRDRAPGYLASLRSGTVLGQLRTLALVLVVAPLLILAISPLIVRGGDGGDGVLPLLLCVPLVAGALVTVAVGPRTPRPLPPGQDRERAAALALVQFRQAVLVRYALAEGVILLGLPLAIAAETVLVFLAGFVLGYPLLLWLALPTAGMVERIRRRLEARGAQSHLWAALLAPALARTPGASYPPRPGGPGTGPGPVSKS